MKEIVLAGGCFWGIQKAFSSIPGVESTECGYANGDSSTVPTYELVCSGRHGWREAVKVRYDESQTSLHGILAAFLYLIDPSQADGQGNDRGVQYRTGVYWTDPADEQAVRSALDQARPMYPEFHTECGPLTSWGRAEEEHQNYLKKHPGGYCHIPDEKIDDIGMMMAGFRFLRPP